MVTRGEISSGHLKQAQCVDGPIIRWSVGGYCFEKKQHAYFTAGQKKNESDDMVIKKCLVNYCQHLQFEPTHQLLSIVNI